MRDWPTTKSEQIPCAACGKIGSCTVSLTPTVPAFLSAGDRAERCLTPTARNTCRTAAASRLLPCKRRNAALAKRRERTPPHARPSRRRAGESTAAMSQPGTIGTKVGSSWRRSRAGTGTRAARTFAQCSVMPMAGTLAIRRACGPPIDFTNFHKRARYTFAKARRRRTRRGAWVCSPSLPPTAPLRRRRRIGRRLPGGTW